MIYDLTNPLHRKQFARRANKLLLDRCRFAVLSDESRRTPNQNRYLHVLCRIMALETGVSETYAKEVYFKQFANTGLFVIESDDPVTGMKVQSMRSSADLTKEEMKRAITNFRHWAADNGYYLPEATTEDDGTLTFASTKDEEIYKLADLETRRAADMINASDN